MAKRNWPDHPAVGLQIGVRFGENRIEALVVDAKDDPMVVDTSTFDRPEADIRGTIILRIKLPGGEEKWLPPTDGQKLCEWAAKQRDAAAGGDA